MTTDETVHLAHLRETFAIARRARAHGNRPFGALLIAGNGAVLAAAENRQLTDGQILAHAEMNLLHRAVKEMSAGAVFWSGVSRLGYGLSGDRLHELSGFSPQMLVAGARDVLARAGRRVEVVGPLLEREAEDLFAEGVF